MWPFIKFFPADSLLRFLNTWSRSSIHLGDHTPEHLTYHFRHLPVSSSSSPRGSYLLWWVDDSNINIRHPLLPLTLQQRIHFITFCFGRSNYWFPRLTTFPQLVHSHSVPSPTGVYSSQVIRSATSHTTLSRYLQLWSYSQLLCVIFFTANSQQYLYCLHHPLGSLELIGFRITLSLTLLRFSDCYLYKAFLVCDFIWLYEVIES